MQIETMEVVHKDAGRMIINKTDYDPEIHTIPRKRLSKAKTSKAKTSKAATKKNDE